MKNIIADQDHISVEICENNQDKFFVFGDNLLARGKAGQAVIRDCINAFGIPTKRLPCMDEKCFFSDREDELFNVQQALMFLYGVNQAKDLVWPKAGIGTGLAELEKRSPVINKILNLSIAVMFDDPYGILKQKTPLERG